MKTALTIGDWKEEPITEKKLKALYKKLSSKDKVIVGQIVALEIELESQYNK